MSLDPSLLSPSIGVGQQASARTYSVTATFLVAFLGGPFAALAMHALNVRSWDLWERHRRILLAAAPLTFAVALVHGAAVSSPEMFSLTRAGIKENALYVRMAMRAVALIVWAALYLRLRGEYRAAAMHGDARSPWKAGLLCVVGATAAHILIGLLAMLVLRS